MDMFIHYAKCIYVEVKLRHYLKVLPGEEKFGFLVL